ncbi:hypothetical protein SGCZBJ_21460 [Caulobacter zeae]|uniref:Uncharacterized protein n=1 Tax=Caulobacter zeae TaxID=2055137 RepID=A0A2N5D4U5_9CAUL|nr:hypothetical protein [Caulobacter zeae]PLR21006.1 hypothetical protein SGCZBJ_21460 [Caulobacter zeae]
MPEVVKLSPTDDPFDRRSKTPPPQGRFPNGADDLPYSVELWSADKNLLEQVIAVSASPSIGYAAYYAATREYPGRVIVLRHLDRVISRWDAKTQ